MKHASRFVTGTCLLYSALLFGQNSAPSTQRPSGPPATNSNDKEPGLPILENKHGPIDILSDTKGVDLHPYLDKLQSKVKINWYNLIPDVARAPLMKKGKVSITFRVMKDGKIANLQYVESSGDLALDRAAYGGITGSSPAPPLPSEFACQYVELRFHFYYNPDKGDLLQKNINPLVPCVTTTIRLAGAVGITVSPSSVQVVTGAKQQFSATVTGDMNSVVTWSVGGPGCAASTCGVISAEGLYTAPLRIPNPATITVTATLATTPSETASATLTIVQSSPPR